MGFHYEVCTGRTLTESDPQPLFNVGREVIRSFGLYHFTAVIAISGYLLIKRDIVSQSVMVKQKHEFGYVKVVPVSGSREMNHD